MEPIITYRGRLITEKDISTIKEIILKHPEKSRRFISQEVCRVWGWRQANGFLKDMVCRSLLLLLESKELIKLPPKKCFPKNPLANRKKPRKITVDTSPIIDSLKYLSTIKLEQVRKTRFETLFNSQ